MSDVGFVWAIAETLFDNVDGAAACSHRPTHVEHIFLDANSRHYMACSILAMPEMQHLKTLARYAQHEIDNDGDETKKETDDWRAASLALREWLQS